MQILLNPVNMVKKATTTLSTKDLLEAYRMMLLIRRFEERCGQAYGSGLIGGFCHLYIGQEAVAVGAKFAMKSGDSIITSYREHGHALLHNITPDELMSELFGKDNGSSRGRGGSMHIFNKNTKFFGGHGIVGAQTSLGTGIAFAEKYNNTDNVCLTFLGDGAVNQGQFYESMNMAKLLSLPVLYIIENNQYSMGTSVKRGCAMHDHLYNRGSGFGIEGLYADGMDFFHTYEAISKALKKIRHTQEPMILELRTYRYRGHSMSDPAQYRGKEELDIYKNNHDPIASMANHILSNNLATADKLEEIEDAIVLEVKNAYAHASKSSEPDLSSLHAYVYADC